MFCFSLDCSGFITFSVDVLLYQSLHGVDSVDRRREKTDRNGMGITMLQFAAHHFKRGTVLVLVLCWRNPKILEHLKLSIKRGITMVVVKSPSMLIGGGVSPVELYILVKRRKGHSRRTRWDSHHEDVVHGQLESCGSVFLARC